MKKIKYHQSQHDLKLDEFYKFKADVYAYLDGKYETLTTTYGTKIKTLSEFIESAEGKIRQLMDVKTNHELQFDEFISKYNSKLSLIEDNLHQLNTKSHVFEASS
jgi:4-hydroxyphenylpyruvate dioxygenase-like putative hemolysin